MAPSPAPASTVQHVITRQDGHAVTHEVQVLPWPAIGWRLTRCLTHGLDETTRDRGTDLLTAQAAAGRCRITTAATPERNHHARYAS